MVEELTKRLLWRQCQPQRCTLSADDRTNSCGTVIVAVMILGVVCFVFALAQFSQAVQTVSVTILCYVHFDLGF